MQPAQQRFHGHDLAIAGRQDRLEFQHELALRHGAYEIALHFQAAERGFRQHLVIEHDRGARPVLGAVEREISTLHHIFYGFGTQGLGNADADADIDCAPVQPDRLADEVHDRLAKPCEMLMARGRANEDRKLVAAEAIDRGVVMACLKRLQPRRNLDQQLVAGLMALGVVDELELVQVKQQQGVGLALGGKTACGGVEGGAVLQAC